MALSPSSAGVTGEKRWEFQERGFAFMHIPLTRIPGVLMKAEEKARESRRLLHRARET
jgi:hypothetical protein